MNYRYVTQKAKVCHLTRGSEDTTLCGKSTFLLQGVLLGHKGWDLPQCLKCLAASDPGVWPVGTYVWMWWDTGAMGASQLIGRVVQAGPKAALIEWPNGVRNRVKFVDAMGIQPCFGTTLEVAKEEWGRRDRAKKVKNNS